MSGLAKIILNSETEFKKNHIIYIYSNKIHCLKY